MNISSSYTTGEKNWARFRSVLVLILFATSVVGSMILIGDGLGDIDPMKDLEIPSVNALYPQAVAIAAKWHPYAYITRVIVNLHPSGHMTTFMFDTPDDVTIGLLVYIQTRDGDFEIETEEVDASGRTHVNPPIGRDEWVIDSVETARIAYEGGGRDFIQSHPSVNDVFIQLRRISGSASDSTGIERDTIVWRVVFSRLPYYSLDVYIDPITGEILGDCIMETDLRKDGLIG